MPKTQRDCLRSPRTTKEDATERTTELNCWNKFDGQQNLQPSPQEDELRCGDIEKRKYYFSDQTFNYIEFQRISTDFDRFHELSSTFGSRYSGEYCQKDLFHGRTLWRCGGQQTWWIFLLIDHSNSSVLLESCTEILLQNLPISCLGNIVSSTSSVRPSITRPSNSTGTKPDIIAHSRRCCW